MKTLLSRRCSKGGARSFAKALAEENKSLRHSPQAKRWRETVFKRDNWTCQDCMQRGGNLLAHHIKSWKHYPNLRFIIDNGVTLCISCHKRR